MTERTPADQTADSDVGTEIREMENDELAEEIDRLGRRLEHVVSEIDLRTTEDEYDDDGLPDLELYGEYVGTMAFRYRLDLQ